MNIKKILSDWAESTFPPSQSAYQADIQELPEAPPLLFTGSSDAGYCVTIQPSSHATRLPLHVAGASPTLGFWIPASGAVGSQAIVNKEDDEILIDHIDWMQAKRFYTMDGTSTQFHGEEALLDNLSTLFKEFIRNDILFPALEKWLDSKSVEFEEFSGDIVSGIEPPDEQNWRFLLLPADPIEALEPFDVTDWSATIAIGVTGDGRAALFSYHRQDVDPCGHIDAIQLEKETASIHTPADLHAWLEATVSPHLPCAAA